jgi:hypothetical protein
MKLSIFKLYSVAIALPLIVVSLITATPAGAELIDRSRSRVEEPTPSVTDLNLSIPTDREQSNPELEIPAKPTRKNLTNTDRDSTTTAATTEQPSKVKSIRRRSIVATNLNSSTSTVVRETSRSKPNSRQRLAAVSRPPLSGNYLRLVRDYSKGTNDNGNPIYTLEAYVGGERYQTFSAVSGIASSQQFDRNVGNNHAPLPDGLYRVSDQIVPGAVPEVGRTFIGIYPQFQTNRSDLGIHVDPSFNKKNGSDGTSGCIGLTTAAERDAINEFVAKYHPHNLYVSILSKSGRE